MNGINETTTTTGTSNLTLVAVAGRPRFTDFFTANASEASADIFPYSILTRDSPPKILEWGLGYCTAVGTLVRAEVLGTYVSGVLNILTPSAVDLDGAIKDVVFGPLADTMTHNLPNIDSASTGMIRGHWSGNQVEDASNGAVVTRHRCYYNPIKIDCRRICNGAVIGHFAAAAGTGKSRLALFAMKRNGYIGRKLIETADVNLASGSPPVNVTAAWADNATIKLLPGWYFLAHAHDYATTQPSLCRMDYLRGLPGNPLGLSATNPNYSHIILRYEDLTGGWTSLPSAANATTNALLSSSNNLFKVGVTFA